jgi:hypothetical protein
MFVLFEIADFAAVEALFVSVPESLGLLAFGIGLVVLAVLTRSFFARGNDDKKDGKGTEEA